jgi:hypothetical protein
MVEWLWENGISYASVFHGMTAVLYFILISIAAGLIINILIKGDDRGETNN